jgi:hypothetical protein
MGTALSSSYGKEEPGLSSYYLLIHPRTGPGSPQNSESRVLYSTYKFSGL